MAPLRRRFDSTRWAWILAVVLGLAGVLLHYHVIHIAALGRYDFLLVTAAFALLAIAGMARGI
jgi:uncharacterized membrane protein